MVWHPLAFSIFVGTARATHVIDRNPRALVFSEVIYHAWKKIGQKNSYVGQSLLPEHDLCLEGRQVAGGKHILHLYLILLEHFEIVVLHLHQLHVTALVLVEIEFDGRPFPLGGRFFFVLEHRSEFFTCFFSKRATGPSGENYSLSNVVTATKSHWAALSRGAFSRFHV